MELSIGFVQEEGDRTGLLMAQTILPELVLGDVLSDSTSR
jgi:hypothetical protein